MGDADALSVKPVKVAGISMLVLRNSRLGLRTHTQFRYAWRAQFGSFKPNDAYIS